VVETTLRGQQVVRELFQAYVAQPEQMPSDYVSQTDRHRAISDYIAGMTDRFAIREHERLTGTRLF
jgi:dGTPase